MPQPRDKNISQPPRGTRDFYPIELARRRWIEDKWRRAAVRHGFDEIDGPTFEHLDLYTVKSGEGIVSELFSFTRAGGETNFALRPEFTPTLARMVAAKANALPKPIKWFSIGPYFRAERPQRGRLREFLQWNADILGDDSPQADAELIACCVDVLVSIGLSPNDVKISVGHRYVMNHWLRGFGVVDENIDTAIRLVDAFPKLNREGFVELASQRLFRDDVEQATAMWIVINEHCSVDLRDQRRALGRSSDPSSGVAPLLDAIIDSHCAEWCEWNGMLARGLAYYTGTVFEVHETGGKERAIAGGGRYDNLVELFGGPPTPAVGFAMGDVVLSLVLQDKGLMPSDEHIAADLNLNPDVFVLSTGDEQSEHALVPALALLRARGLHARRSYKSTRNIGKLLQDASKSNARFALILESSTAAKLKDLGAHSADSAQHTLAAPDLAALIDQAIAHIPPR